MIEILSKVVLKKNKTKNKNKSKKNTGLDEHVYKFSVDYRTFDTRYLMKKHNIKCLELFLKMFIELLINLVVNASSNRKCISLRN